MADERVTPSGWLPPRAPDGGPPPRFEAPPPPPPAVVRPQPGQGNPHAVWALVLSITGLALLLVSLGTFFLITLPCSVAGWVLARKARTRIAGGETAFGEGQATAALWLARIGFVAGVAAGALFIALLASGFDFEQFRDDLERELDDRRERRGGGGVRTALDGLRATIGR